MTDEVTPAPDVDKPEVTDTSAPDGTSADVEQLRRSYDELRSKFNERDQEVAELRKLRESLSDPDRQAEILNEFGIELADLDEPDLDDGFADPVDELRRELDELKRERQSELQRQEEERASQAFRDNFDNQIVAIEGSEGRELSEKEIAILHDRALVRASLGEEPSVEALYRDLDELWEARKASYLESKKSPRVAAGRSASEQPNLDDESERHRYMMARFESAG